VAFAAHPEFGAANLAVLAGHRATQAAARLHCLCASCGSRWAWREDAFILEITRTGDKVRRLTYSVLPKAIGSRGSFCKLS